MTSCPGMFCGRLNLSTSCFSSCQACPRGYRVDEDSLCRPCDSPADPRDYLYLVFMGLVMLFLRLGIVTFTNWYKLKSPIVIPFYIIPGIETTLSVIFTLLVLPPQGSIGLNSCRVSSVNDFYPIFFNPSVDYVHSLKCSYEVVYPLYSMVFIFLGWNFLLHLPFLITALAYSYYAWSKEKREYFSARTEYVWLILYPFVLLIHGTLAGLIYYTFDYVTIILAIGAFAVLSTSLQIYKFDDMKNTFKVYILGIEWLIVIGSIILLSCGILSLTEWSDVKTRSYFLPLVLLPPLIHPLLNHFAAPLPVFQCWGVKEYSDLFEY